MNKSYVYLVENNSEYKIGKSNSPKLRLSTLQVGNTSNLNLLYLLEFNNESEVYKAEKYFHKIFKNFIIRGERFKLKYEQIHKFKTYYKLITVQKSQFEYWTVGIDFIDAFAAMSKREQTVTKFIKDCIKWDSHINSFNFIVELSPDSVNGENSKHFETVWNESKPCK